MSSSKKSTNALQMTQLTNNKRILKINKTNKMNKKLKTTIRSIKINRKFVGIYKAKKCYRSI